ncbi:coatomer subunit delta [Anaeramoeba flamelloides]|uniref:Coatomer subunit delta n=1 Tax=Anaeramoeba flamelloides TaxID=1746091 RepID=A0ABQ8YQ22_9EUKA|nr:coatomer subunit delta [Anaeramoeba flamelloides]
MVILSVAISTKKGNVIFSRQYISIRGSKIEGLLSAFPKLIQGERQHTYVETDNIRYVYQPIEKLYLLILTTKSSNILEDLETLRLLSRLVPEYCSQLTEQGIQESGFELIFAFDEVIANGYKENVSKNQIETYIKMESSNEERYKQKEEEKRRQAVLWREQQIQKIEQEKEDRMKMGNTGGTFRGGFGSEDMFGNQTSHSGNSGMGSNFSNQNSSYSNEKHFPSNYEEKTNQPQSGYSNESKKTERAKPKVKKGGPKKGLVLGSRKTQKAIGQGSGLISKFQELGEIKKEDKQQNQNSNQSDNENEIEKETNQNEKKSIVSNRKKIDRKPVHFEIRESITVLYNRTGDLEKFQLAGALAVRINEATFSKCGFKVEKVDKSDNLGKAILYSTFPKINKRAFAKDNLLIMKNQNSQYPSDGSPTPVMKWQVSDSSSSPPIVLTFWPSPSSEGMTMVAEYSLKLLDFELRDVTINIPVPGARTPVIQQIDGEYSFNSKDRILSWTNITINEENQDGVLEFLIPKCKSEEFYPVEVKFETENTYSQLKVMENFYFQDKNTIQTEFSQQSQMKVKKYQID